jgi:hypothetical protein
VVFEPRIVICFGCESASIPVAGKFRKWGDTRKYQAEFDSFITTAGCGIGPVPACEWRARHSARCLLKLSGGRHWPN